jgi:hypothetical protein
VGIIQKQNEKMLEPMIDSIVDVLCKEFNFDKKKGIKIVQESFKKALSGEFPQQKVNTTNSTTSKSSAKDNVKKSLNKLESKMTSSQRKELEKIVMSITLHEKNKVPGKSYYNVSSNRCVKYNQQSEKKIEFFDSYKNVHPDLRLACKRDSGEVFNKENELGIPHSKPKKSEPHSSNVSKETTKVNVKHIVSDNDEEAEDDVIEEEDDENIIETDEEEENEDGEEEEEDDENIIETDEEDVIEDEDEDE